MDDLDEYELLTKKPLKLKDAKSTGSVLGGPSLGAAIDATNMPTPDKVIVTTATQAEKAFKSKQDKVSEERILKKASKTHKQRVEDFNKHLDSLSEHYDIPKVSWTK